VSISEPMAMISLFIRAEIRGQGSEISCKSLEQIQSFDTQVNIINGVAGGENGGAEG